jgi:putative transposase
MPQSLANIAVHIIFSTKNREPWLQDPSIRHELYAYLAIILKNKVDSPALIINGIDDHIHLLISLSRKVALMNVIAEAKTETSKWLKKQSPRLEGFSWQAGYGAFSVSESNIPQVRRYIENQETHHQRVSFQDEFREFCAKHAVELDEPYAWD